MCLLSSRNRFPHQPREDHFFPIEPRSPSSLPPSDPLPPSRLTLVLIAKDTSARHYSGQTTRFGAVFTSPLFWMIVRDFDSFRCNAPFFLVCCSPSLPSSLNFLLFPYFLPLWPHPVSLSPREWDESNTRFFTLLFSETPPVRTLIADFPFSNRRFFALELPHLSLSWSP